MANKSVNGTSDVGSENVNLMVVTAGCEYHIVVPIDIVYTAYESAKFGETSLGDIVYLSV
jgi:hypothetical protein